MVGYRSGRLGVGHVGVRCWMGPDHTVRVEYCDSGRWAGVGFRLGASHDPNDREPRGISHAAPNDTIAGTPRTRTDSSFDDTVWLGGVGVACRGCGSDIGAAAHPPQAVCTKGAGLDGSTVRYRNCRDDPIDRTVLHPLARRAHHGRTNGPTPANSRVTPTRRRRDRVSSEGVRPNTRGGDTWTVLLLTLCNLVVPVVAYIWGIVRLSQTDRWNKIQKLGLALICPAFFLLGVLIAAESGRSISTVVETSVDVPAPVSTPATQPAGLAGSNANNVELRSRPLVALPSDCRKEERVESLSKDLGPMTGSGLVRVVGDPWNFSLGPPANFGSKKWGGNKLLIAVHTSAGDHVLVRGKAVTPGTAQVGFGSEATPVFSLDLRVDDRATLDGGWIDFPNMIRLEKLGCYILQFDYPTGTTRLALRYVTPTQATCDARPIMTELAISVGVNVDVTRFFSAADFAWVSDLGVSPVRIGDDAARYATLPGYFSRLAAAGDRWSVSILSTPVQSGVANFQGELTRGRPTDGNVASFKGAVRCSTGKIIALSVGATRPPTTSQGAK